LNTRTGRAVCPLAGERGKFARHAAPVVASGANGYRGHARPAAANPRRAGVTQPAVSIPPTLEAAMAKSSSSSEGVYRVIDVVGSSDTSWEDAARNAVETAGKSLRDLRVAEVQKLDVKIENGKVLAFRARLQVSFKYEAD
jgi:flavin-binding protein dodecin